MLANADGDIYFYKGAAGPVNLGTTLFTDVNLWELIVVDPNNLDSIIPGITDVLNLNLTDSEARAIGITFVMNDVRSDADALLHNATVIAVSLSVVAKGSALLISTVETNVSAIGGNSLTGQGTVFAKGGQSVANVVLASSRAIVSDSTITLTGDLLVQAINGALLDATLNSSFASACEAVGIALAFNSIGWKASNILFNALETLLGDALLIEEIDDAAGDNIEDYIGTQPAEAIARITGSSVIAANVVGARREQRAQLNATVSNAATSEAAALYGAEGSGGGPAAREQQDRVADDRRDRLR